MEPCGSFSVVLANTIAIEIQDPEPPLRFGVAMLSHLNDFFRRESVLRPRFRQRSRIGQIGTHEVAGNQPELDGEDGHENKNSCNHRFNCVHAIEVEHGIHSHSSPRTREEKKDWHREHRGNKTRFAGKQLRGITRTYSLGYVPRRVAP
jgi:hypothetical protein